MHHYEIGSNNEKFYPVPEGIFNLYQYNLNNLDLEFYKKKNQIKKDVLYLREKDYIKYSLLFSEKKEIKPSIATIGMMLESSIILIQSIGINPISHKILNNISIEMKNIYLNNDFKKHFKEILISKKAKEILLKVVLARTIAKELKIKNETVLNRLLLTTLFCDLGNLYEPKDATHQEKSIDLLSKFVSISDDIKQGILHHHENNDGTGPYKIFKHKIHPFARIIRVVDEIHNWMDLKSEKEPLDLYLKKLSVKKLDSVIVSIIINLINPQKK